MGLRGPHPDSAEAHRLRGSWRAAARAREEARRRGSGERLTGEPPEWLDDLGAERWREVVELFDMRPEWAGALEIHCATYSTWRRAAGHVAKHGPSDEFRVAGEVRRRESAESRLARQLAPILAQQLSEIAQLPPAQEPEPEAEDTTEGGKARFFSDNRTAQ